MNIEYPFCNFDPERQEISSSMTIGEVEVSKCEAFWHQGSTLKK